MVAGQGPVPGPVSAPGPLQLSRFGSGSAHVQVTGASQGTFEFTLVPSSISLSPPTRLDLAYGDPATGEGLSLQLPPEQGTIPTSKFSILTLDVRLAGVGTLQATAMHGECSITLGTVGRARVNGRFVCRRLRPNVGPGPTVAATGTFSAQA
jgi:hypothetical protein